MSSSLDPPGSARLRFCHRRLAVLLVLAVFLAQEETQVITLRVLSDAYWQVTAYVACTLALFYQLSSTFASSDRLKSLLNKGTKYQVGLAACMGALPGCGGAIIVVTQFVRGQLSFGSVVAVLVATMGDASFLLLSVTPTSGLLILTVSLFVGIAYGIAIDAFHGEDYMRPSDSSERQAESLKSSRSPYSFRSLYDGPLWKALVIPTGIIALLLSFQVDLDAMPFVPTGATRFLGATIMLLSLLLWSIGFRHTKAPDCSAADDKRSTMGLFHRVAHETNFVTCWVVLSFLAFELTVHFTQIDLAHQFAQMQNMTIVLAIALGLIPGCGPQIMVAALYIGGVIPMSAQLGNSISNDGDALFPAIALAPKVALLATLYTTIPAIVVAFSYRFFLE